MDIRQTTRTLLATTALVVLGSTATLAQDQTTTANADTQAVQLQVGQELQQIQDQLSEARQALEAEDFATAQNALDEAKQLVEQASAEGAAAIGELSGVIEQAEEAVAANDAQAAEQSLQEAEQLAQQAGGAQQLAGQAAEGQASEGQAAEGQVQMQTELEIQQPAPTIRVTQAPPKVTVHVPAPIITVEMPEPEVSVDLPDPEIEVIMGQPELEVAEGQATMQEGQQAAANVEVERAEAEVDIQQEEPQIEIRRAGQAQAGQESEATQQQLAADGQPVEEAAEGEQQAATDAAPAGQSTDQAAIALEGDEQASDKQPQEVAGGPLGQMSAEELLDSDVVNEQGETIASVNDVVVRPGEDESHLVLGVGGLFGIGERVIALPITDFELTPDDQVMLPGMTQERLENLPEYDPGQYEPAAR